MKYAIDRLRKKALHLLRERHALIFVISGVDKPVLQTIQNEREQINQANKSQLQSYIKKVTSDISQRRTEYGVCASGEQLINFLENAESSPPGQSYYPTVVELREFFQDYAKVWADSALFPAHVRVCFDPSGLVPWGGVRILEATIYEDMASLWNLLKIRNDRHTGTQSPRELKTNDALCRSTVAAAVYFVEAYLNGLAFDYLTENSNTLTEENKEILSDFDFSKNRPRYLSLREKILKYQQIILQKAHAPIQPNNLQPLECLLEISDSIRNSLAHPAPNPNPRTGYPDKELAIYSVTAQTAQGAVDSAIELVLSLETLLHGDLSRISWLLKRNNEGEFSEEAFD